MFETCVDHSVFFFGRGGGRFKIVARRLLRVLEPVAVALRVLLAVPMGALEGL